MVFLIRIIVLSLQQLMIISGMKHIEELTETEWDLIETIRNYKKSFPNGEPRLRYYINRLFAELLDEPLDD
jgi:hypothetical protein